jgi:hypothetical protein
MRPLHQDRHDYYVAFEPGFDFTANEIRQSFLQRAAKITAQSDAINVHEQGVFAQSLHKIIVQSSGLASSNLPSVTNEDGTHVRYRPIALKERAIISRPVFRLKLPLDPHS